MKKKTYEAVCNLLQETCGMDNLIIVKDDKMFRYKSADISDEGTFGASTYKEVENTRKDLNEYEMAVLYDGGYMYSIMSGEFGWSSHDIFIEKLKEILKQDGLGYDLYDNVTMVIYRD